MGNPDDTPSGDPSLVSTPPGLQGSPSASVTQIRWIGGGLMLLSVMQCYLLLLLWPGEEASRTVVRICLIDPICSFGMNRDAQLLMVVLVAGALGSFIHTATSFADFVGNRKLTTSWIWWYLLKPFIGSALALVLYLVVRGGLLAPGAAAGGLLNVHGIVALAALAGMFSKQATDKLSEVFGSLFQTKGDGGDAMRKDGLVSKVPGQAQPPSPAPAPKPGDGTTPSPSPAPAKSSDGTS